MKHPISIFVDNLTFIAWNVSKDEEEMSSSWFQSHIVLGKNEFSLGRPRLVKISEDWLKLVKT